MSMKQKRLSFPLTSRQRSGPRGKPGVSLNDVHADILLLILQHLNWPEDFHSLALVCRVLNRHVTPELYKTIVVTPHPLKTLALLAKLDKDDAICGFIQVLVFDNVVRSIRPRIPAPDEFEQARKRDLADVSAGRSYDGKSDRHRVRLRLYQVLPKLRNLHTVCVKQWSHILQGPLSAAECYNYWQPHGYGRKLILEKLRLMPPYPGPPAVMHGDRQPCPLDIISLLLLRCENIRKLFIVGMFPEMKFSNPPSAFSNLTVLVIGERSPCAQLWNSILRNCQSLKVFGLLNAHFRFEKLIAGCRFPHLESIEWYGYIFSSESSRRKHARAFPDFIQKHSETLKCISLAPRSCQPRGFHYDGGVRFLDPANKLLPNLETLRLQNWTVFSADHDMWPHTDSTQSRALAEEFCHFVAERPKIVDLTITGLPTDLALHLTTEVLAGRNMKRVLVGESLHRSQAAHVPPNPEISSPQLPTRRWSMPGGMVRREQAQWTTRRKLHYLREAWESYEISFQGLTLEQSGYRPWLSRSKCPHHWRDYLRQ